MRTASPELQAILASGQYHRADLYTFTLVDGTQLKYTSYDQDISGFSSALGWERSRWKLALGLAADTMDVTLHAKPTDLIGDLPVIEHISAGFWDGAQCLVERAIMPTPGDISAGTLLIFSGDVADITEIGRLHCSMQLQSDLYRLNKPLPSALFQPTCRHVLYGPGCGLNRADFQTGGSAGGGSTKKMIAAGLTDAGTVAAPGTPSLSSHTVNGVNLPPNVTYFVKVTYVTGYGESVASVESHLLVTATNGVLRVASPASASGATGWNAYIGVSAGAEVLQNTSPIAIGTNYDLASGGLYLSGIRPQQFQGNGTYALGTLRFDSGVNAGLQRSIESSAGGNLTLRVPFPEAPAEGDLFTITLGCDHTAAQCTSVFDNLIHFGGTPYIPAPEMGSA